MSLKRFSERLEGLGCKVSVNDNSMDLDIDELEFSLDISDEWQSAIRGFYRARQYQFHPERRILTGNRFSEFQVVKLDPGFVFRPSHKFTDQKSNEVLLASASNEYQLSYFESSHYQEVFDQLIKRRLYRKANRRSSGRVQRIRLRMDDLLLNITTATYKPKRKPSGEDLKKSGKEKIKACLFNLAYSKNECWEIREEIKSKGYRYPSLVDEETELEIPTADYDSQLISHYKLAKSSLFPGQVFLSYYHILEYFFLRVADEELFQAAKSQLNDPEFKATYEKVTKLLASVKRHDNTSDEKRMLQSVLRKYVEEQEYIDFVKELEERSSFNVVTEKNQKIFGEKFNVKLEGGHALSNTANLLKHIRNSLVHSSDRYSRQDCYQPFSESEGVVARYIPIIQFMAEKVIFSTAE